MKNIVFKNQNTDPEFAELIQNFACDEVVNHDDLDDRTRMMAILSTLIGSQSIDAFKEMLVCALDSGVTPVQVKEIVYQATAYLGFGKVLPFLQKINELLQARGIALPLAGQATAYLGLGRVFPFLECVNDELRARDIALPLEGQAATSPSDRLEKGEQAQVDIFGDHMRGFSQSGPEESRHINKWLSDNCFGDYYTRTGLDYKEREMITFCFLAAQGGCEPQLTSHAAANLRIGNDKTFLIKIISQCLPYIGYPRSLNALRCVNEAAK